MNACTMIIFFCVQNVTVYAHCGVYVGDDKLEDIPGCYSNGQNSLTCNCSYVKSYTEPLNISCIDSTKKCRWFHELNDTWEPIEKKFRTDDSRNITLLGYYDNESYGTFIAKNSSDDLCYYLVVPTLEGMQFCML